jgi:hypothetical protein
MPMRFETLTLNHIVTISLLTVPEVLSVPHILEPATIACRRSRGKSDCHKAEQKPSHANRLVPSYVGHSAHTEEIFNFFEVLKLCSPAQHIKISSPGFISSYSYISIGLP